MSCMHIKNRNKLKDGPKSELVCFLRKILLVCAFYKLEYLSFIGVVLSKFL
jgi:hypothetical protein